MANSTPVASMIPQGYTPRSCISSLLPVRLAFARVFVAQWARALPEKSNQSSHSSGTDVGLHRPEVNLVRRAPLGQILASSLLALLIPLRAPPYRLSNEIGCLLIMGNSGS